MPKGNDMGITMETCETRADWLEKRAGFIGGSDCASIVGLNPRRTNVELWELKTGRRKAEEISSPAAKYGTEAEKYLRALFALDYPEYKVGYVENNIWFNDKYPFAHASLDGWLEDANGRRGVLEIKTTQILNPAQWKKWDNQIPPHYYCQVLWYMGIIKADFAILTAQIKWQSGDSIVCTTRHYTMEQKDVQEDIDYLFQKGAEFAEYIKRDVCPPLILPMIGRR